jgi:predicted TPR repeat methyltransferase
MRRRAVHILELGCGTGELAHQLAKMTGARVTGVDLSARFVAQASRTHACDRLSFMVADLSKGGPASDEQKYDCIVGNGILHHLYHRLDTFLPALACRLAPGGRLIFWEPNLLNPYIFSIFTLGPLRRLARLEPGEMAFTSHFIERKLADAGFEKASARPKDFLLPNTSTFLVPPVIWAGDLMEQVPILRWWSQSLFIMAEMPAAAAIR